MAINSLDILTGAKLLFLLVLAAELHGIALGQREKQGCYDLAPLTCDPEQDATALAAAGIEFARIEETCRRLNDEVFPRNSVAFDPSQHEEYLNSIEASEDFCADIQLAYRYCSFCQSTTYLQACHDGADFVTCGGQPSLAEVLADTTIYALFGTQEEIVSICVELEVAWFGAPLASEGMPLGEPPMGGIGAPPPAAELWPPPGGGPPEGKPPPSEGGRPEGGKPGGVGKPQGGRPEGGTPPNGPRDNQKSRPPLSVPLCERQALIKHLCPGQCDGGCFTEDNPPSCEAPQAAYPLPTGRKTCDELLTEAFDGVSVDIVLNVSSHLPYLQSISNESAMCRDAQREYSSCFWCQKDRADLCFNSDYPTSCEPPPEWRDDEFTPSEIEQICHYIADSMFGLASPDNLYNISSHTGNIFLQNDTVRCDGARKAYHKCQWCFPGDPPDNFCHPNSACSSEVIVPEDFDSPELYQMGIVDFDPEVHCDLFGGKAGGKAQSLAGCYDEIFLARHCQEQLCPEPEAASGISDDYLGATTTAQKRAIIWLSRVSALLSFLGASYILYDSLSDPKARKTVYHQLLIGIAIFDLCTALAWGFATAPIDASDPGADHVEGAMGTSATCTAQGFFIQLGFTSVFYNTSLALYYVLVIAFGYREFQIRKLRPLLHGCPILLGLGLAFGGIPIYGFIEYGCHIPPGGDLWVVLVFVVLPIGLSIVAITASMLVVYCKVRHQTGVSKKWSLGFGQANKMEQAVFWQCLFYVLAFFITWPILFSVYLFSVDEDGPLGLALTVAFVAPLQGFSNACVYVRPVLLRKLKKRRDERRKRGDSSALSLAAIMRYVIPLSRLSRTSKCRDSEISASGRYGPFSTRRNGIEHKAGAVNNNVERAEIIGTLAKANEGHKETFDSHSFAQNDSRESSGVSGETGDGDFSVRMTDPSVALAFVSMHKRSARMEYVASGHVVRSNAPAPVDDLAERFDNDEDLRDQSFAVDDSEKSEELLL